MTTSPVLFVALSFFAVSIRVANADGVVSGFCEKAKENSWYPAVPIECCGDKGKCDTYINPNQTAYGLRNPEPWPRRLCRCDIELYRCVTKGLSWSMSNILAVEYAFGQEICFRNSRRRINGKIHMDQYEFVLLVSVT